MQFIYNAVGREQRALDTFREQIRLQRWLSPASAGPAPDLEKLRAKDIVSKAQLVLHLQGDVALLLDPDIVDKRLQWKRGNGIRIGKALSSQLLNRFL